MALSTVEPEMACDKPYGNAEGKMRNAAMSSNGGYARANLGWLAAAPAVCVCATCAVVGDFAADGIRTTADYVLEGPELVFLNPLFSSRIAELWRRDAP